MKSMTVERIRLHPVGLPLVERLHTSASWEPFKSAVIVELTTTDGVTGWGECPAKMLPSYAYESMGTALHVMSEFLIDYVVGQTIDTATDAPKLMRKIRGHPMAKAGIETAVWDALAKTNELRLADLFAAQLPAGHNSKGHAVVGVSIGIQATIAKMLEIIALRVEQGYERIKLKIEPGWDVEPTQAVRTAYPDISLMLDANSAYTLADADQLKQLDAFDLLMIEQPLGHDDIYQHTKLQPQLESRICLDESIHTLGDAMLAVENGACSIINLKPARVSGFTESLAIYRYCVENGVDLWIGGLLETGVGRAANLAFASLPGVTMPSDISATDRYFDPDLTEPPFVLAQNSTIDVPDAPGIGVTVVPERLQQAKARWVAQYPYRDRERVE